MKRFLSLLLAVALIVAWLPAMPLTTNAAVIKSGTCGENVTWTLDAEGTLTISGTGAMKSYNYASYVPWYSERTSVKEVIIEDGVTTIGGSAFYECTGLTSVTIPDSVTDIDWSAFAYCTGLTSVTIGDSVTTIGNNAFSYCDSLTSVTIGNGVTTIGDAAFWKCTGLTSITIPDSVTTIGNCAFYWCTGLTSVTIGNSVTTIGEGAFSGCTALTDVYYHGTQEQWNAISIGSSNGKLTKAKIYFIESGTCGENVTWTLDYEGTLTISGTGAMKSYFSASNVPWYSERTSVKEVIIEDGVTTIGERAFYECTGLTSITIPDSVTTIGAYAFYNCYSLTSITIPDSVTTIGNGAFSGCTGLRGVYITDLSAWFKISFYNSPANPISYAKNLYLNGELVTDLVIPDSVTTIGGSAFSGCTGLTSVTIPNSVTEIDYEAFSNCTGLTSITIPDSVTSIGDGAFYGCSSLTSITIPDSVTGFGTGAFNGCTGLTSVTIPDSVTYISEGAFYGCTGLISVTIPDSVTSIGGDAFSNCTGLTSITIPDSVTSIYGHAFYGCTGLTSVTIGNSVTSIGDYTFYGCTGLTDVYYHGTQEQWNAILVGSDNTYLTEAKIHFTESGTCGANLTWTLTDGILTISGTGAMNSYNSASYAPWYSERTSVKEVIIEDGVTTIGSYAFYSCTGLTSITIPDSVTSIGGGAFYGCTGLTDVYYHGTQEQWNAISIGSSNENLTGATLHTVAVTGAIGVGSTGKLYASWDEALNACEDGDSLYLLENIADTLTVRKNISLDLNGYDLGGLIAEGATVILKDSATDDYTVEDGKGYGKITGTFSGVVAQDGYMMITENGETSFHRLNLDTVGVNVRASATGLYFSSQFGGDEVIKRNIVAYGTAMGAGRLPNFAEKTYTRFETDSWQTGCDDKGNSLNLANGTLLEGILSEDNTYSENKRNANMKIYSQAYVELEDGTRIYGEVVSYSLRDIMEGSEGITGLDAIWETLSSSQKTPILELFKTYQTLMRNWDIPNIKAAAK